MRQKGYYALFSPLITLENTAMGYKKYAKDYESEVYADIRGRLHTKAVYRGKLFRYKDPEETVRRQLLWDSGIMVLGWAALFAALLLNTCAGRTFYVVLPTVCCFLPMVYVSWSLMTGWLHKAPMKREFADGVYERRCSAGLLFLIFAGISLGGYAVMLVLKRTALFLPADVIYGGMLLLLLASAILLFRRRSGFAVEEIIHEDPAKNA